MMYDNPRQYWSDRFREQGPEYAGPFGSKERSDKQAVAFKEAISENLKECGHLLDFGSGPGRLTEATKGVATLYTGVDFNKPAISYAQEHNQDDTRSFIHMEGDRIPFPTDSFDAVMLITVAQHIPDEAWEKVAAELSRVTTSGAQFLLIDHADKDKAFHMFIRTPDQLAEDIGFTIVSGGMQNFGAEDHHHNLIWGLKK